MHNGYSSVNHEINALPLDCVFRYTSLTRDDPTARKESAWDRQPRSLQSRRSDTGIAIEIAGEAWPAGRGGFGRGPSDLDSDGQLWPRRRKLLDTGVYVCLSRSSSLGLISATRP